MSPATQTERPLVTAGSLAGRSVLVAGTTGGLGSARAAVPYPMLADRPALV